MRVQAITADITTLDVDVIVNATNNAMIIGGGVDGAIHKAAGPELINYNALHHGFGCPTGLVKVTPGFTLPAKEIYHTVGPDMRLYNQEIGDKLLELCYGKCMALAIKNDVKSIAFPAISTGIFGFDKERAAKIAVETVMLWRTDYKAKNLDVIFACFAAEDAVIINKAIEDKDAEIYYLLWSIGQFPDDGSLDFEYDFDTDMPDGIYKVYNTYLGVIGGSDGVTIKDGKFVMEPTLRAVAEARNESGYWGTFLEGLTWNEKDDAFHAAIGS